MVVALALLMSTEIFAVCNPNIALTKPNNIYTDNGDGTVTDNKTGLMWMKCSLGQSGASCATGSASAMNWKQALELAQVANVGVGSYGYTDWRLPNKKELGSLTEKACYAPSINTALFPNIRGDRYWSASNGNDDWGVDSAWYVDFNLGIEVTHHKNEVGYVRLVRGGQ